MDEIKLTGGVPMVKIDGAKVRSLRESKGLTQLFLATSVNVTTDTISRWENKRYPTIKRENGIKLAEALEVDLDEILEKLPEEALPEVDVALPIEQDEVVADEPEAQRPNLSRKGLAAFFFFVAALFLGWWLYPSSMEHPTITSSRLLPHAAVAGQPFPVAITVSTDSASPLSLILKEILPKGAELLSAVPPYSAFNPETGEIKWLRKIDGEQVFAYRIKINNSGGPAVFSGTVAVRKASGSQITVKGDSRVKNAKVHWADADGDGCICDEEILVVYDVFSEIEGLGIDVDQVEEIWLGSGYEWNEEEKKFEVVP
ncbi:MAG: helix-turn-helix domain-containing protein [Desulfobulbaceae bacterium]|nr:helix-turn-helix domain-containing protein [Desulfobulbaceae bacterium]